MWFFISLLMTVGAFADGPAAECRTDQTSPYALKNEDKDSLQAADQTFVQAPVEEEEPDSNQLILQAVREMPKGGGYGTNPRSFVNFDKKKGQLVVSSKGAVPSYCTMATYLVFSKYLEKLQKLGKLKKLSPDLLKMLEMRAKGGDGHGVWGRWNANGPGISVVAHQLGIGTNFTDPHQARPGDFMKIFWSNGKRNVAGKGEKGHTVVFLGTETKNGKEQYCFWSSNQGTNGYGRICMPPETMQHTIFTRLKDPSAVVDNLSANLPNLPEKDDYLASLVTSKSSFNQANLNSGIVNQTATGEP